MTGQNQPSPDQQSPDQELSGPQAADRQSASQQLPGQQSAPITDEDLAALLKRAIRITLVIGILASLALWISSGWRNAAMMATGTAISAASIYEWRRLSRFITAKLDYGMAPRGAEKTPPGVKETPRGVAIPILFFLFRLMVFAGAIYVSLKCFRGSAIALLCGLGLAVLSLVWEALGLLRN